MSAIPTPVVLECMHFVSDGISENRRIVSNYEFDLYLDGRRDISLDGTPYIITQGSLVFCRPGQFTTGKGDYNMYLLTLDFSGCAPKDPTLFRSVNGICQPPCDFDELNQLPAVFKPTHFTELKQLFGHLSHCSYPGLVNWEQQKTYMKEFLRLVLYDAQIYYRTTTAQQLHASSVADRARDYIIEHFYEPIQIKEIAAQFFINENYLIRLFRQQYHTTPNRYLLETRLVHARHLLLQTDQSVKEIAYSCGFNTPSYFIRRFCDRFGTTPYFYRREFSLPPD